MQVAFQADHDALADAREPQDLLSENFGDRRDRGAQQEGIEQLNFLQAGCLDPRLEALDIDRDVREFGHTKLK